MMNHRTTQLSLLIVCTSVFATSSCCAVEPAQPDRKMQHIRELIAAINDHPDQMHYDYTPSVFALIDEGEAALPGILDLASSEDFFTRARVQNVAEGIVKRMYGFEIGRGWSDPSREKEYQMLLKQLGELDPNESSKTRTETIARWRSWIQQRFKAGKVTP